MEHRSVFWSFLIVLLLCCFFCGCHCGVIRPIPELSSVNYSIPGDLTFGMLMAVHRSDGSSICGPEMWHIGRLQRMESLAFAVREINKRRDILPNITLGFIVLDDCNTPLGTLGRGLQFIQYPPDPADPETDLPAHVSLPAVSAVAVIGAENTPRTVQIADLFTIYKVPQLSYLASGIALDDKKKYSYFSRTVPSDQSQFKLIVEFMIEMEWSYVSIIYAEGTYGLEVLRAVRELMLDEGMCLAVSEMLGTTFDDSDYEAVLQNLLTVPEARVVILFVLTRQATQLFRVVQNLGLENNFTFLASDTVAAVDSDYKGLEYVVHGLLTVAFKSPTVYRFEEHFKAMTIKSKTNNPWFDQFAENAFNCSMDMSASNACDPNRQIGTSSAYTPDPTTALGIDAVYALAHALDLVLKNCTRADVKDCVAPQDFLTTLRNINFIGEAGAVGFDINGNGINMYEVRNTIMSTDNKLRYEIIAEWNTAKNKFSYIYKNKIHWNSAHLYYKGKSVEYPKSICNEACPIGHRKIIAQPHCCFHCESCKINERTVQQGSTMIKCDKCTGKHNFSWPDELTRTKCVPIEVKYLLDVDHAEGIFVICFNTIIFFITLVISIFYAKNAKTRLIKASSVEMSVIILASHLATCVLNIGFFLFPTDTTCILNIVCFEVSFPLSYAPLLIKTNRIYRIFMRKKITPVKIRFISRRTQIVLVATVVLIQIVITTTSLVMNPPMAKPMMHNFFEKTVEQECDIPLSSILGSTIFNFILVILCTVHAFQTRSVPGNFNEARYITFSVYTTILIWLSFVPTIFIPKNYYIRALGAVLALLLHILSFQGFLFLPKMYAIYCCHYDTAKFSDTGSTEGSRGLSNSSARDKTSFTHFSATEMATEQLKGRSVSVHFKFAGQSAHSSPQAQEKAAPKLPPSPQVTKLQGRSQQIAEISPLSAKHPKLVNLPIQEQPSSDQVAENQTSQQQPTYGEVTDSTVAAQSPKVTDLAVENQSPSSKATNLLAEDQSPKVLPPTPEVVQTTDESKSVTPPHDDSPQESLSTEILLPSFGQSIMKSLSSYLLTYHPTEKPAAGQTTLTPPTPPIKPPQEEAQSTQVDQSGQSDSKSKAQATNQA